MAWPFSRLRDYIANSLPTIRAADLNSIQDYINHVFNGAKTVKSLQADGTGNAASTASAGEVLAAGLRATTNGVIATLGDLVATAGKLTLGATRSNATVGAGQSVAAGTQYKDTTLLAWAIVHNDGATATLVWGANISTLTRAAVGDVTVVLTNGAANKLCPVPSIFDDAQGHIGIKKTGISATTFKVLTFNAPADPGSPVATDYDFMVHVYGG